MTSIRIAATTAATLCVLAVGGGPAGAAAAGPPGSGLDFKAEPAAGSQTGSAGSYFVLRAQPGRPVTQSIALNNQSREPLTLALHAESATTGPIGGVSYSVRARANGGPAVRWLSLGKSKVTLAPGASTVVPLVVTMPRDGRGGLHLAGISIERITPKPAKGAAAAGAGAGVVVHSRRIIAVQVTTPGPRVEKLEIEGVTAAPRADGMYLLVDMRNAGNTLLTAGTGEVAVTGAPGLKQSFKIDTFVPGTQIAYPIRWAKNPSQGDFQTSVTVRVGNQTVRWAGSVPVGQRELQQFDERSGNNTARPKTEVLLMSAGAALLAAAAAVLLIAHRRRNRADLAAIEWY